MNRSKLTTAQMMERVGFEIGVSDWILVEQSLINQFSESTKDHDWLHIDPERAKDEGPYGGPVAFGFWTLGMLTHCSHQIGMWPSDVAYGINYGLDRVRWIQPVPIGSQIRMRSSLTSLNKRDDRRFLIKTRNTMEIDGQARPAMVANWLGLFVLKPS
jgi:acyl dehydratase